MFNKYSKVSVLIISLLIVVSNTVYSASNSRSALVIYIDKTIDPGLVHLVKRSTESIDRDTVVILYINSYGGYLSSADDIIEIIRLKSKYCIAWIDTGTKAVSAAAYIALSCRKIYMAPATVLGGIKPYPYDEKIVSYIESRIRSFIAEKTNVTEEIDLFINKLVREGRSFSVDELVNLGIVLRANSVNEVLERENIVKIVSTSRAGLIESIISTVTTPLVSLLLVLIGGLLIVVELMTTGFQGYCIPGVVMFVIGLYGLFIVPLDIVLLTILLMGVALLVIELLTPGFGFIGFSGIVLLAIGVTIGIYNTPPEARTTGMYLALSSIFIVAGFMLFIMYKAISIVKLKKPSIGEKLINQIGYAKTDVSEKEPGVVYVMNEDWTAYSLKGLIKAGSRVRVVKIEGLKIYVEPAE